MNRLRRILCRLKWPATVLVVLLAAMWGYSTQRWIQFNTAASVSCLQSGFIGNQWGDQYRPESWLGVVPALTISAAGLFAGGGIGRCLAFHVAYGAATLRYDFGGLIAGSQPASLRTLSPLIFC